MTHHRDPYRTSALPVTPRWGATWRARLHVRWARLLGFLGTSEASRRWQERRIREMNRAVDAQSDREFEERFTALDLLVERQTAEVRSQRTWLDGMFGAYTEDADGAGRDDEDGGTG